MITRRGFLKGALAAIAGAVAGAAGLDRLERYSDPQTPYLVELDLDTCSLTCGVGACGAGSECYNTRSTCQDPTNYAPTTKTYRFAEPQTPWVGQGSGVNTHYLATSFDTSYPDIGAWSSGTHFVTVPGDGTEYPTMQDALDALWQRQGSQAAGFALQVLRTG